MKHKRCLLALSLLLILAIQTVNAQTNTTAKKGARITLDLTGANLNEVLQQLQSQSGCQFFYDQEAARKVTVDKLSFSRLPVSDALRQLREKLPLAYDIRGNEISVRIETKEKFSHRNIQKIAAGKISGLVLGEKGESLPGAVIKIIPSAATTQSGADGAYQLSLTPGVYTMEVSFMSYQVKRVTDITVTADQNTSLNVLLTLEDKSLSNVVVSTSYKRASVEGLYIRQKNSASVSDGITAEQISRTPDNNTAQVLKRISGLQVTEDKYVVVRGLSERYNNVLLNGAMLPSSEPNRRNFAFDMVPSSILDRVVVNKTATPDLTGEFSGGLVLVETKDIPAENFLQLTVGTGYNTQSTGKDMIGLNRGNNAWIGFASDVHKKPEGMSWGEYNNMESKVSRTTPASDPNRQKMHQFLSTMPENWTLKKYTAMPTQNYQVQLGRVMPFSNDSRLGLVAALTYRNEQTIQQRDLHDPFKFDYAGTANKYATTLGGSFNMGYQIGKHKFTWQNTYNRRFSDQLWKYTGIDIDNSDARQDSYNSVTVINQLFQSQLGGEHAIGKKGVKADWFASAGKMDRDQPYSRVVSRLNIGVPGQTPPEDYLGYDLVDNRLKNGNLFYANLNEKIYNWAANFQVPFKLLKLNQTFKLGYQGKSRNASFGADLYRMLVFSDGNYGKGTPYDQVFTQENFAKDLYLHSISGQGRNRDEAETSQGYEGIQRLHAGYLMLDLKPLKQLRLIGGLRAEANKQEVCDFVWNKQTQATDRTVTGINQTDWLPSVNAIYAISSKLNARAAWYKTLARPDFRELSSFAYFDYDYFNTVTGSPLQTTQVNNADLRLEYFPSPGEVISVSAFYKKFKNPIETLLYPNVFQYKNLEKAEDKGLEFDFRKSFGFISPSSAFLSRLFLSGNFTWIDASVVFRDGDAVDKDGNKVSPTRNRPLAGQSPYIVNGGLLYAGNSFGVNVAYNRYGKRIVFASPDRASDEYERSRDLIDLQLSYKFLKQKRAEIKLNINDLLNQEQVFYRNQLDVGNPFGFAPTAPSVEQYPGQPSTFPAEYNDPKGTSFNKDYDTVVRRYKFGVTYTINFIYRF
ncbi:TonB-dependent receptor [Filimonas effusa]|uniref:TonB-dependent receptor n=1 Tax=Filimonas effusa TaxID=2508721 RepID=UPI0013E99147|nr:TonB-dependent receptor [Filimonas effusa]